MGEAKESYGIDVHSSLRMFGKGFGGSSNRKKSEEEDQIGVEVNPEEIAPVQINEYEDEVFYAKADETQGYRNNHNVALKLREDDRPNIQALRDTCTKKRDEESVLFEQGMWVEYRSNNMQWKVGIINRVIKQAPDDWDFENGDPPENKLKIFYNVGYEGLLNKDAIRAPEKGLQSLFGKRPWLWQQFTLLQVEKRLRFDPGHEYDFEELDCEGFAAARFDAWLNTPENHEFKENYDSQPEITQKLLKMHLLTPFMLMDEVVENTDEWDFDDPDISVYTYLGVLGSGVFVTLITLVIQLISPLILTYNVMFVADGDPNPRFEVEPNGDGHVVAISGNFLPTTTLSEFCADENENDRQEGKVMIVIVLFVYLATVVPDSLLNFYKTSGGADSTYSKINSLREIIWLQNDDDITQQIGFKLDRLMNTGYIGALYALMLFILIQTPIVLDLILNALAIEFIHEIDERIANSDWWDEGNRYIKAGTLELIIQSTLRLRVLESPRALCNMFDIEYEEYKKALGDSALSLYDKKRAHEDDNNDRYMTLKERTFAEVAKEAKKKDLKFTVEEYVKKPEQFGFFSQFSYALGWRKKGIFHRYEAFRTWSRWNKILFLPVVPAANEKETSAEMKENKAVRVSIGQTDTTEFLEHIVFVLSGMALIKTTWDSFHHGYISQVPVKIALGILEILFYVIQILFPFIVIVGLVAVPYCY